MPKKPKNTLANRVRKPKPTVPKGWKPPPPTINTPLNSMQRAFVKHLVEDGTTQGAAAHLAGYKHPDVVANQLINRPHVKLAIAKARAEYAVASQMTKKRVMDGYLEAIAQAKMISDPSAQIQGWNSIAKMCGYFEPVKHKIEVDIKGKIVLEKLQSLSDEDLLRLAEGTTDVIDAEFTSTSDDPTQSLDE